MSRAISPWRGQAAPALGARCRVGPSAEHRNAGGDADRTVSVDQELARSACATFSQRLGLGWLPSISSRTRRRSPCDTRRAPAWMRREIRSAACADPNGEHVSYFLQPSMRSTPRIVWYRRSLDHLRQRLQERCPVRQVGQAVVIAMCAIRDSSGAGR